VIKESLATMSQGLGVQEGSQGAQSEVRRTLKTQILWKFFVEFERDPKDNCRRAKCLQEKCNAILRLVQGGTSSLRAHLVKRHPGHAAKLVQQETEQKKKQDSEIVDYVAEVVEDQDYEKDRDEFVQLQKIDAPTKTMKNRKLNQPTFPISSRKILDFSKWTAFDKRQLNFDQQLMTYLIESSLSFNHVESAGFLNFMQKLLPRAQIKSATTFSR
jgi:hypothetical protein